MSNIANTIQYLKSKENRYITITVQETGKSIGKANIYLADLPNEDLEQYIKNNLGPITKPTLVWVEMRTKQGPTSKKDHTCAIEISPGITQQEVVPQQVNTVPAIQSIQPQFYQEQATPFLGAPNVPNVFGLGLADVMAMQRKADRLTDREEQLADLKEDHKELKKNHELQIGDLKRNFDTLEKEYRDALTKLSVAEEKKEIAIMFAKAENKSVFESPAFAAMMEKAPELISGFVALKSGGASTITSALGSPNVSESHRQFVGIIEDFSEEQINFLGSVCHYINNELFVTQLKSLIQQFHHA